MTDAQNSLLQYSSLHSLHLGQLSRQLLQPPVGSNTDVGETWIHYLSVMERGYIERIEPILAIIFVEKLLIFQPKWVIYMSKNIFCLI